MIQEKNNFSGITPVGLTVLVLPDQLEEMTVSGIVIPNEVNDRHQLKQTDGVVIEISSYAYNDEPNPRCKIGDRIIMAAYAGMVRTGMDGLEYRLIKDNDVVAVLDHDYKKKKVY